MENDLKILCEDVRAQPRGGNNVARSSTLGSNKDYHIINKGGMKCKMIPTERRKKIFPGGCQEQVVESFHDNDKQHHENRVALAQTPAMHNKCDQNQCAEEDQARRPKTLSRKP